MTFNFTNNISQFSEKLSDFTITTYDYYPEVGDTITFSIDVLGENITIGKIVKINKLSKKISDIAKKIENNVKLNQEEKNILNEKYLMAKKSDRNLEFYFRDCNVEFEMVISKKSNNPQIISLINELAVNETKEIFLEKLKVIILKQKNGNIQFKGFFRTFVGGDSLVSTKKLDKYKEKFANTSEIENVAWGDDILKKDDVKKLNKILDEMIINEPEDYHPGSENVVRDLVHPALYCYVKNVSKIENNNDSLNYHFNKKYDFWGRKYETSDYQWLPSEFFVDVCGKVSINSYINNLDKTKYSSAYPILENIFQSIFSMFETVCNSLNNDFYGVESEIKGLYQKIKLKDRKLQVITKIVEYKVNEEVNFDGVWHVEGMSHENILATGLCIIKREQNFKGADIEFRRFLFEHEGENLIYSIAQESMRPTDTMGGGDVLPLGKLETPEGRVIVFPNSHIHRLTNMYSDNQENATRRILVFWLVNPQTRIISTEHVKEQQQIMSLTDAQDYRLKLMLERKLHKENYQEREVYLCEH